jgi:hypothetical protein
MKQQKYSNYFNFTIGILACFVLSMTMVSPAWSKNKLPEVSSDGLHLLKKTKVRVAYAKPGMTLDKYSKVKILDCFVQFKKNWEREYNMNEIGLSGRVTDKDADIIKKRLATEFNKVFTREMTKAGHEVVDEVGPDVLLLRPALLNVEVSAPDIPTAGMSATFVASAGQMTLYMELYDSSSNTLLARVIDPKAGNNGGIAMAANRVTNMAEADRILSHWARLLDKHLGDVKQSTAAQ